MEFDYVVTVCGHTNENCPAFPGKTRVVHVGIEDPPQLTKHLPDGEEKLTVYRKARDKIRRFVEGLPASLCPWLIRKFIDPEAEFLCVPADQVKARAQELGATPFAAP